MTSHARVVADLVRTVPDFPSPGVLFSDIAPVLADPAGLAAAVHAMAEAVPGPIDAVVGVEARGFILGAPVALALGCGFVPVRKPGKLPGALVSHSYALEYGESTLTMQVDALPPGARVWIVDDVLATGGTVVATADLVRQVGGVTVGVGVLLELPDLGGRDRIVGAGLGPVCSVVTP
ncbi:adenine phosphoribosyltransferase [Microlunatus sp. Y2014]|uniref:adenine phosphoribosyltransferase n=1 Tax=Microlunatus sp. Y2014 TaxID=3418488 RepID=UPI003DA74DD2